MGRQEPPRSRTLERMGNASGILTAKAPSHPPTAVMAAQSAGGGALIEPERTYPPGKPVLFR
jgi:hypothetical protein